jgi:transposase
MKKFNINKSKLKKLYVINNLGSRKVAKIFNCNASTVLKYLKKYNIKCKKSGKKEIYEINKTQLKKIYNNKTQKEIAKKFKCSYGTVANRLRKYKIKIKRKGYWLLSKKIKLTQKEKEILNGNLLGDGGLYKHNAVNAHFTISSKYKKYCQYLFNILKSIKFKKIKKVIQYNKRTNKFYSRFLLKSKKSPTLTDLHNKWYYYNYRIIKKRKIKTYIKNIMLNLKLRTTRGKSP